MPPRGPQSIAAVLNRTRLATNQVKRKQLLRREKERIRIEKEARLTNLSIDKRRTQNTAAARRARKEDYQLGPLAPRRDVGDLEGTYGTVHTDVIRVAEVPKWRREKILFKPGDRVVMLQGRDKGEIGVISEVDETTHRVFVKDSNLVDIVPPAWMDTGAARGTSRAVRTIPIGLPHTAVRLVTPLENRFTGERKDVIVERVEERLAYEDTETGKREYDRIIPDLGDEVVSYPREEDEVYNEYEADTPRILVEPRSFDGPAVTLGGAPMPLKVLDELRNKRSRGVRKRQDRNYLQKIQQREEEHIEQNVELLQQMRTPLQELHALRAQQRKDTAQSKNGELAEQPAPRTVRIERGKPWKWKHAEKKLETIDEEFLSRLGAMMAEKNTATKTAAA